MWANGQTAAQSNGERLRLTWLVLAVAFVGVQVVGVVIANNDQNDVAFLWVGGLFIAILLGATAGRLGWNWVVATTALALLVIPIALPFGDTNRFTGGDDLHSVAFLASFPAVFWIVTILGAGFVGSRSRRN